MSASRDTAKVTAFVTGGAGGMGQAICRAMVASGRKVVVVDRNGQAARDFARELGPLAHALALDITDPAAVDGCLSSLPEDFATIDILVNNAGHDIGGRKRFDIGSADDWTAIIETNLIGLMRVTRAILPGMVERNRGDVVNMSSISALRYVPDMAPYSASKAGVHMLSDVIRGELAETAIRVVEIMPGLTRTGIVKARYRGDEEETRRYFEQFRMALDPEDVARCIMFAVDQPPHVQMAQMVVLPVNRW
jgi:3-hydroxy acid dehydrogenase/malonic semialdehyde reductase